MDCPRNVEFRWHYQSWLGPFEYSNKYSPIIPGLHITYNESLRSVTVLFCAVCVYPVHPGFVINWSISAEFPLFNQTVHFTVSVLRDNTKETPDEGPANGDVAEGEKDPKDSEKFLFGPLLGLLGALTGGNKGHGHGGLGGLGGFGGGHHHHHPPPYGYPPYGPYGGGYRPPYGGGGWY